MVFASAMRLLPALWRRPPERQLDLFRRVAKELERLGGGFVKAGQLLSTRGDLLREDEREAFSHLCDSIERPGRRSSNILGQILDEGQRALIAHVDPEPFAVASVTCVYRAVRRDTGAAVAIKAVRAEAVEQFGADAAMLTFGSRLLKALPPLRSVPVVPAAASLGAALSAQTDLTQEAAHHRSYSDFFARWPEVVIPRLHEDLCGPMVLTTDYLEGARRVDDGSLDASARRVGLATTLRALYAMIFELGLVHCDLHPGNFFLLPDGRVALLDFGYVAELEPAQRLAFADFFLSIALQDAPTAARVVVDTALRCPQRLDASALEGDIALLLDTSAQSTAGDFQIARFVSDLFGIMRTHRIEGTPGFSMAILGLVSLEGLLKQYAADLDFQREAMPFLVRRTSPTGNGCP